MNERASLPMKATSDTAFTPAPSRLLQRRCACGGTPGPSGECEQCRRKRLQRSATRAADPEGVPPIVDEVLRSPGRRLDPTTRTLMERRFGHDFGRVRIHTDGRAARSADAVSAHAYSVGQDVVFGSGRYAPMTPAGQYLLAHELTHTMQQGEHHGDEPIEIGSPFSHLEVEAESAAAAVLHGGKAAVSARTPGPLLSRNGGPIMTGLEGARVSLTTGISCFTALMSPMRTNTRTFIRNYCQDPGRPVPSNVYDAFGHCWIACESSRECGRGLSAVLGTGREIWRELDEDPHDSYSQDLTNQGHGREFSEQEGSCLTLCQTAARTGTLDLSAPTRHCIDCSTSEKTDQCGPGVEVTETESEEGTGWLPPIDL